MAPTTDPPPDGPLRGSAAILGHLIDTYGVDGLPADSIVALALAIDGGVIGQARLRGLSDGMTPFEQVDALGSAVSPLVSDPRGARADSVLLCVFRSGAEGPVESDAGWWSALSRVCYERDLLPADVICRTPQAWHAVQAGTRGPLDPSGAP